MGKNVNILVRRPRILVRTRLEFVFTLDVIVRAVVVIIWRWYPIIVRSVLALIVIFLTILISLVEVMLAQILALVTGQIILAYKVGPLNSVIDLIAGCRV